MQVQFHKTFFVLFLLFGPRGMGVDEAACGSFFLAKGAVMVSIWGLLVHRYVGGGFRQLRSHDRSAGASPSSRVLDCEPAPISRDLISCRLSENPSISINSVVIRKWERRRRKPHQH
jgi:hypothetical protein